MTQEILLAKNCRMLFIYFILLVYAGLFLCTLAINGHDDGGASTAGKFRIHDIYNLAIVASNCLWSSFRTTIWHCGGLVKIAISQRFSGQWLVKLSPMFTVFSTFQ